MPTAFCTRNQNPDYLPKMDLNTFLNEILISEFEAFTQPVFHCPCCCLSHYRHLLHHCFQALMDHGVKVASVLANSFSRRCSYIAESDAHVKEKAIQFGFVLGTWMFSHSHTEFSLIATITFY